MIQGYRECATLPPVTPEEIEVFFARRSDAVVRRDYVALTSDYAVDCVVESPIAGTQKG
jgi:hypothetical protein